MHITLDAGSESFLGKLRSWRTLARGDGKSLALDEALRQHQLTIAHLLLAAGADPRAAIDDGFQPLHIAAERGNTVIGEMLIVHAGVNANDPCTPRLDQSLPKDFYGGDACSNNIGRTPLHAACRFGKKVASLDFVRMLINHKADVNCTDAQAITPLLCVCQRHWRAEEDADKQLFLEFARVPSGGWGGAGRQGENVQLRLLWTSCCGCAYAAQDKLLSRGDYNGKKYPRPWRCSR